MNEQPLQAVDGRRLPAEVKDHLRRIAVHAVLVKGYSPEAVIDILGLSHSCIYTWLRRYQEEGWSGLTTHQPPGTPPLITPAMDDWLYMTVTQYTPQDFGYDTLCWSRDLLAELMGTQFGVKVGGRAVSQHLRQIGLSYQTPAYQASEQDPAEVQQFLEVKFPAILRLAEKLDADIAFEDESGVSLQTHSGQTWGAVGERPVLHQTGARAQVNVLAAVEASGRLCYRVKAGTIESTVFIAFLAMLIRERTRPLILLADRVAFHRSSEVRAYVRAHRHQLRIFFLPRYAPERNPAEHVWEELKDKKIGRQPLKNKSDLINRIHRVLADLQGHAERVTSFFQLPETRYANAGIDL